MPRYVALLRGVNVGGHNKVAMARLRTVVESLGHTDVTTFIQSGNVIFTSAHAVARHTLEGAIEKEFGIDIVVVVRSAAELAKVIKADPFAGADHAKVHVGFMARGVPDAAAKKLDRERFLPEEFAINGSELYLHLPNGMGRTKLPAYLDRQLKVPTTVRNWKTVTKLLELAHATAPRSPSR